MNGNELGEKEFKVIRQAMLQSANRKTGSLVVGLESSAVAIVHMDDWIYKNRNRNIRIKKINSK